MSPARRLIDIAASGGITRAEVAVACGVSVRTVERWATVARIATPVEVRGLRSTVGVLLNERVCVLAELHDEAQAVEPDALRAARALERAS